MKERMKRWCAVAVLLLMGLSLFTAVAYGAYLLGGVYAAVGYIGFNVMVGIWLFREITRAPMRDNLYAIRGRNAVNGLIVIGNTWKFHILVD